MKTPTQDDAKRFVERAEAHTKEGRDLRAAFEAAFPLNLVGRHKVSGKPLVVVGHHPEWGMVQVTAPGERGNKVSQPFMLVTDIEFTDGDQGAAG